MRDGHEDSTARAARRHHAVSRGANRRGARPGREGRVRGTVRPACAVAATAVASAGPSRVQFSGAEEAAAPVAAVQILPAPGAVDELAVLRLGGRFTVELLQRVHDIVEADERR
jgi:hypothetical protein